MKCWWFIELFRIDIWALGQCHWHLGKSGLLLPGRREQLILTLLQAVEGTLLPLHPPRPPDLFEVGASYP